MGTKTWSGGDDRACLVRSLRAEKALSVAFESRLAWLTRILLPPEPQEEPYNQPHPHLQPPANAKPRKMDKTVDVVTIEPPALRRRDLRQRLGARVYGGWTTHGMLVARMIRTPGGVQTLLISKRASPICDRLWHAIPPPTSYEEEHRDVHSYSPTGRRHNR